LKPPAIRGERSEMNKKVNAWLRRIAVRLKRCRYSALTVRMALAGCAIRTGACSGVTLLLANSA
jgi:hypothetical protein